MTASKARPKPVLPTLVKRALVVAFCAAGACVALGSGIDRAGATDSALAKRVPAFFAAASLERRGAGLVQAQRYREALPLAVAMVRAAPIEPVSTALLGAARLGAGDAAGADQAFLVAGHFGWREPITQYYWMQRALQVGDYRVAALRLDAMLRQQPDLSENSNLIAPVQAEPAGRDALAKQLLQRPAWLAAFADKAAGLPADQLEQRADVFDRLLRDGVVLGCNGSGRLAAALVGAGLPGRGKALWDAQCGTRRSLIGDAQFARLQAGVAASPFDWTIVGDGDVSVSLATAANGGRRLEVASTAAFPRKIMTQLAVLEPGRYRLAWTASTDLPISRSPIAAVASCQPDSRDVLTGTKASRDRYVVEFQVDGSCPARWIGFLILPGSPPVQFGNLALDKIG